MPVAMEKKSSELEGFLPKKEGKGFGGSNKPGGKRSFLQKAKKFGMQGKLGRGFQVDSDTYSYFVRILELLQKDEFSDDEERELFVENSLKLAEGNEVDYSSNQLVSRVFESVLLFANEEVLLKFCQSFTPSLRVIVSDPFASHVLEKLLELTSSDKWRSSKDLTEWFEKTSLFILNNYEEFTFDKYSNFVMKKVLECFSGFVEIPPNEKEKHRQATLKKSKHLITLYGARTPNPKWENMLKTFAQRFMDWPQFNDLHLKPETARLLQNIVQALHRCPAKAEMENSLKALILRVLDTLPGPLEPGALGHRTLEVCLSVANESLYRKIYKEYYEGSLKAYCDGTSYTLQTILAHVPDKNMLQSIFKELSQEIPTLIENGRAAIIHHLAEQCNKLNMKKLQQDLYELLKKNVPSVYGKDLLISLITLETQREEGESTRKSPADQLGSTYFGTCLVEQLIEFDNPCGAEIIASLVEMESSLLRKFALDRKASFILSKFFKCWKIPQKAKIEMLKNLKDVLVDLAMTAFGSRIVDDIWLWADIPQKIVVAEALSERIPQLAANRFGRFMVENMGLNAFKRNKKEWMEHMSSVDRMKKDARNVAVELGLKADSEPTTPTKEEEQDIDESSSAKKKEKKRKSKGGKEMSEQDHSFQENTSVTPKNKRAGKKSEEDVVNVKAFVDTEEAMTPKKKKGKKNRNSEGVNSTETFEIVEGLDTPKKKKKGRKSENNAPSNDTLEDADAPINSEKKKKKKRKSEKAEADTTMELNETAEIEETETPRKKKKKNKKSEGVSDANVTAEDEGQFETPKKKQKRQSEVSAGEQINETPKKKKKDRKSKQFD